MHGAVFEIEYTEHRPRNSGSTCISQTDNATKFD